MHRGDHQQARPRRLVGKRNSSASAPNPHRPAAQQEERNVAAELLPPCGTIPAVPTLRPAEPAAPAAPPRHPTNPAAPAPRPWECGTLPEMIAMRPTRRTGRPAVMARKTSSSAGGPRAAPLRLLAKNA